MKARQNTLAERIRAQAVIITALVLLITLFGLFLAQCWISLSLDLKISGLEKEAQQGMTWEDGEWIASVPEALAKQYNAALQEKDALIETSDIAAWWFTSQETTTGTVVLVFTILIMVLACVGSIIVIIKLILSDICDLSAQKERVVR